MTIIIHLQYNWEDAGFIEQVFTDEDTFPSKKRPNLEPDFIYYRLSDIWRERGTTN
jgi:hypothetical protein